MQRYFYSDAVAIEEEIELNKEDSHHIVRVMRSKVDDEIIVVDSTQTAYLTRIIDMSGNIAQVKVMSALLNQAVELPIEVTIACGLSKNDKIDLIVQKGTECGMSQFIPLELDRDVVKWKGDKVASRVERLERISKEAAEQCHRNKIPTIQTLQTIEKLIQHTEDYDHKLIAYEETAKLGEHGQLKKTLEQVLPGQSLSIVFGSEGGITPIEVEKLKKVGYIECSLGPRILRAETAPIYALSAISYHLEV